MPLAVRNSMNSIINEWGPRFGWSPSMRWWQDSRGHGYCASDQDAWLFRSIFHPRDAGYIGKAAGLVDQAEILGVIPAH